MSRRKRRGVSKSKIGRRYQSDFINVTQKPRALIIDPVCDRCKGRAYVRFKVCKRCLGTGKDPEGDKWFDNHDRVKTTFGPKWNQSPLPESTWVTRTKEIVEDKFGWKVIDVPTERQIPPTKAIGAPIVHTTIDRELNIVRTVTTPSSSAVRYTHDNLPKVKNVEALEILKSSARLTIIERMKFITIKRDGKSHLKMGFCGDQYCFVEEFETYSRRSMIYTGKPYAIRKLKVGIDWVEFLKDKKKK